MAGKTSKGKQRIEMKKIENESHLRVAFSKRRGGLFKKAGEFSTLTGADLAVIAFSPSGKPFSYGSPSVEHVLNQLEHGGDGGGAPIGGDGGGSAIGGKVLALIGEQDAAKKRAEVATERDQKHAEEEQAMGLLELIQMKQATEVLQRRMAEIYTAKQAEAAAGNPQTFNGGGGINMFATGSSVPFADDPAAAGPSPADGGAAWFVSGDGGFRTGPGGPI